MTPHAQAKISPRGRLLPEGSGGLLVLLVAASLALALAAAGRVDLGRVTRGYAWSLLAIYICLDLFTEMLASTGLMEVVAVRLAAASRGRRWLVMAGFGGLLFFISGFLNNLTATLVVLSPMFVLLRSMSLDRRYVASFFALMLAMSNLGGASTAVGDFPALLILQSGLTSFAGYTLRAFALFGATAALILAGHVALCAFIDRRAGGDDPLRRELGALFLQARYRHRRVDRGRLVPLAIAFGAMFLGWLLLPGDVFPPHFVAAAGVGLGAALGGGVGGLLSRFELGPALLIGAFLLFAGLVADTGLLDRVADWLTTTFTDPVSLLAAVMVATSLGAGVFSAGPTAAAMLPLLELLAGPGAPLSGQADLVAVAFAAAICAGSSLGVWSATAGFLLLHKVGAADLRDERGQRLSWTARAYLRYGLGALATIHSHA